LSLNIHTNWPRQKKAVNKKTKKKAAFEDVSFDTFNKGGKIASEVSYYNTKSTMDAIK